jgi:hypothetical protein
LDQKAMQLDQNAVKMELHRVSQSMPSVVIGFKLSASEATTHKEEFRAMLDFLKLSMPTCVALPAPRGKQNMQFNFKWGDMLETQSYASVQPFIQELLKTNDPACHCAVVGNGEHLGDAFNLYDKVLWSLRSTMGAHGETLAFRGSIRGRTDLIVYSGRKLEQQDEILRHRVIAAVEVKMVKAMSSPASTSECAREAIAQLVGLNVDNDSYSPAVVLTNLAQTHKVYFLEMQSQQPLQYQICVNSTPTLGQAILFAVQKGSRLAVMKDFARPPTPGT